MITRILFISIFLFNLLNAQVFPEYFDDSCTQAEKEYFTKIAEQNLSLLGTLRYFHLFERPVLSKNKDNHFIITANLAIFNGFVWKYEFKLVKYAEKQYYIYGIKNRVGDTVLHEIDRETLLDVFKWLKTFLSESSKSCVIL